MNTLIKKREESALWNARQLLNLFDIAHWLQGYSSELELSLQSTHHG